MDLFLDFILCLHFCWSYVSDDVSPPTLFFKIHFDYSMYFAFPYHFRIILSISKKWTHFDCN